MSDTPIVPVHDPVDLYTAIALRPNNARGWLAVCVVAVCALLAWCASLVAEHFQAGQCYNAGGAWVRGACTAPEIKIEVTPGPPRQAIPEAPEGYTL